MKAHLKNKQAKKDKDLSEGEKLVRLPSFDWDKAKIFYYVAKLGSFSEAANFLHTGQPSISRKIKILESHLKCQLFTRVPRGVEITRKGDQLFEIMDRTFNDLKGFSYSPSIITHNGKKRKIRIATSHAVASYIISDLLFEYSERHPHLIFDLIGNDNILDVHLNDVDIAIRPIDFNQIRNLPREKNIQQERLFSLEKNLYASRKYLEKYGYPQSIEDLKYHHLIAIGQPEIHPYANVNWILTLGMPKGKFHEPIFTTNSVECMIGAAMKGLGIIASYKEYSIIKNSDLQLILPNTKCQELEEYFICPDHLKNDPDIINLKNYLKSKIDSSF